MRCDVAIVGGGIVGALLADRLSDQGLSVVVADKRGVARGSTSASTALLLYELDVHLADLIERMGRKQALRVYALCFRSIGALQRRSAELGLGDAFRRMKSLYVAFQPSDVGALEKEFRLRRAQGLHVRLLEREDLRARFGLDAPAALLSRDAAEVDPVRLTHALLQRAGTRGVRVFGGTDVRRVRDSAAGCVLETDGGVIRARRVVVATGYEAKTSLPRGTVRLTSSYVVVSEPIAKLKEHWLGGHVLWETSRPYLYVRTTRDDRIMVGGEDEQGLDVEERDALIPEKARTLAARFREVVPDVPFRIAHAWAGTFGDTKDGVGYVGVPPGGKNAHYILGYGGNGIVFGNVAADIFAKTLLGRPSRDSDLFGFDR